MRNLCSAESLPKLLRRNWPWLPSQVASQPSCFPKTQLFWTFRTTQIAPKHGTYTPARKDYIYKVLFWGTFQLHKTISIGIHFRKITWHVFVCDSENYKETLLRIISWKNSCQLHKRFLSESISSWIVKLGQYKLGVAGGVPKSGTWYSTENLLRNCAPMSEALLRVPLVSRKGK